MSLQRIKIQQMSLLDFLLNCMNVLFLTLNCFCGLATRDSKTQHDLNIDVV